jgi:hypothetical protein
MRREEVENYGFSVCIAAKEEHVPEVERQIRVVMIRANQLCKNCHMIMCPKE